MERLYQLVKRAAAIDETEMLHRLLNNERFVQDILDLNRQNQLFEKGVSSTDVLLSDIGGDYSINTIWGVEGEYEGKIQKGLPYDRITLFNDGNFYKSFRLVKTGDGFKITADTRFTGKEGEEVDLEKRWGNNILGLTDESRAQLVDWIRRQIVPKVIEYLLAA